MAFAGWPDDGPVYNPCVDLSSLDNRLPVGANWLLTGVRQRLLRTAVREAAIKPAKTQVPTITSRTPLPLSPPEQAA